MKAVTKRSIQALRNCHFGWLPARAHVWNSFIPALLSLYHASEGDCNTLSSHRCRSICRTRNSIYETIRLCLYRRGWCPCPSTLVRIWCATHSPCRELIKSYEPHYSGRNVGSDQSCSNAHKAGFTANRVPWLSGGFLVCVPTVNLSVAIIHRALACLLYPNTISHKYVSGAGQRTNASEIWTSQN